MHYSLPKDEEDLDAKDDNSVPASLQTSSFVLVLTFLPFSAIRQQDTLFVRVRNAREPVPNKKLRRFFEKWGDVKDVRECRGSPR